MKRYLRSTWHFKGQYIWNSCKFLFSIKTIFSRKFNNAVRVNNYPFSRLLRANEISWYHSLRWKAVSRYQYKVQFVVKHLIVLLLYCSVCCSFGFHLGTHIKSDALFLSFFWRALCCTVVIYKRLHLSSSAHKLFLGIILWVCSSGKTLCVIMCV